MPMKVQPAQRTGVADEAVFAAGVNHHVKLFARALEGVGEMPGVGGVYVVVDEAVQEEELAIQVFCMGEAGAGAVACRVFLGRAHVALGVNGVVIFPIGHWRAGHADVDNEIAGRSPLAGDLEVVRTGGNLDDQHSVRTAPGIVQ